ncbi:MAG TPA: sensor histidine kinase, partial [Herpetosiphonaceae bacterium]
VAIREVADQIEIGIQQAMLSEQVRSAEQDLQRLSRQMIEVQESERRHLALELHDEIGQTLTGLKLILEMIQRLPIDEFQRRLSEAQALVNDLMARVRQLSLDLRPAMLDDLGLLPTLVWHFERYTAQTNVQVTFAHTGLGRRFPPEVETATYRIVQEALTNVARHSQVRHVTVSLWVIGDMLTVQIEDQGAGFDPSIDQASSASRGLPGMRERAALLGGELVVETMPGVGTLIRAELPVPARAASSDGAGL